jgi:ribosomal protein L37E
VFFGKKNLVAIRHVSHQCKLCGTSFPLEDRKCTQCGLEISKQEISPDMNKTLIELAVEKSILSMGHPELQLVISKLHHDYNCTISDCMEHPEYLKAVLSDLFGHCHYDIVNSIDKTLKMTSMEKPITDFLRVITVHV